MTHTAICSNTGSGTSPLGYDGQYADADTGMIYLRAREYDPKTGQFLSVDPLVASTRVPYYYAGDSPPNYSDPTGMSFLGDIGDAFESISEVGLAPIEAVGSVAEWAVKSPGKAVEAVAAGVCIAGTDGFCAFGVGAALGFNTILNAGKPNFLGHEAVTIGETVLLGGAGLVRTGLGLAGALEGALPETWLGRSLLNATFTWPSVVGIGLENPIDRALFCR
jgi:RHS repeat-associated protein